MKHELLKAKEGNGYDGVSQRSLVDWLVSWWLLEHVIFTFWLCHSVLITLSNDSVGHLHLVCKGLKPGTVQSDLHTVPLMANFW